MKLKKRKYSTSYKVNNHKYGSHIYAYNIREAETIAAKRNIGEKVEGQSVEVKDGYGNKVPEEILNPDFRKLSDYDFIKQLPQIIHTACFLSFIAASSHKLIFEVLSDESVLHELIHLMISQETDTRKVRRERGKFMQLQKQTPGYLK